MKERHLLRDHADELHVVFHHDDRGALVDLADQFGCAGGFLVGHACRRLIKQDQPRFGGYHHAKFHPLALAMGLGIGDAVKVVEGFGMLSMASIGPIISVLATGLWIRLNTRLETETAVNT